MSVKMKREHSIWSTLTGESLYDTHKSTNKLQVNYYVKLITIIQTLVIAH